MHLIQLLLPAAPEGAAVDPRLAETRQELVARFHGATAYLRAPASGDWTSPTGRVERESMVMVEVVADHFDRRWWQSYARTLASRFDQERIHVRGILVEMIDGDPS